MLDPTALALKLQVPCPAGAVGPIFNRAEPEVAQSDSHVLKESDMEKRFRALRSIGTLLKILAWIVLVIAVLAAIFVAIAGIGGSIGMISDAVGQDVSGLAVGGAFAAIMMGGAVLLGGVFNFIVLYAAAEAVFVILAIEENTRLTSMAVSGRAAM